MSTTTATQHHHQTSIEDKRLWIEQKLDSISSTNKSDLLAIDFEVNLLLCAAHSYKHETVLKPFPSTFLSDSNNNKNYTQLVCYLWTHITLNPYPNYIFLILLKLNALESLPPVVEWKSQVKKFNQDQLSLIYWLLVHKNYQLINSTTMNQVYHIINLYLFKYLSIKWLFESCLILKKIVANSDSKDSKHFRWLKNKLKIFRIFRWNDTFHNNF